MELPIRRSRGYAPLPIALPVPVPPTLAVGADLKNTMAVADGKYAWLSQHIGDMDDLATLSAFDSAQQHLQDLTGCCPAGTRRRRASAVPVHRLGEPQCRRSAGSNSPTPPRAYRGGDGRTRPRRFCGRCSDSPLTEPVTARRGGLGRRSTACQLQGLPTPGATLTTYRWQVATSVSCAPTGWHWRICGRPESHGIPTLPRLPRVPPWNGRLWRTSLKPASAVYRHRAWADCSTRYRHLPACARWWPTKRRRRSSWKVCPVASTAAPSLTHSTSTARRERR